MKKTIIPILIVLPALIILTTVYLFFTHKPQPEKTNPTPSPTQTPIYPRAEKYDVPILMYHYIRDASNEDQLGKNLSVSPDNFDAQLKWLKDDKYASIYMSDLTDPNRQAISRILSENKKPIIFTFDDGYNDAYTNAFPTLKKYGFTGTFYIIKDYINKDHYLTDGQISEMQSDKMEFGSHTLTHPDLTKIDPEDAKNQIEKSKDNYQSFCYPAGRYNDAVINLVRNADYQTAVTTKIGIANETSDLLQLRRVRIENVGPQELIDKISYAKEDGN